MATLLIVATVVAAMADRGADPGESRSGRWRPVLGAAALLAVLVAVANVGMCVEVLSNASGAFIAPSSANKLSSVVGFLAPTTMCTGVVLYAGFRLRASGLPGGPDTEGPWSPSAGPPSG